jgi:type I restriction enzyme S subunit
MAFQATYPAYQESGRPWVPKVPQGWNVLRNGRLFTHRVQTGFPDLPILEVSLRTGVRVRDMENLKRKQVMSQKEKYKRAAKGDIAYNMMRMWQGALGPAPVDGLVSPAYVVVKPFEDANSAYYSYLFRTDAYMREVNKCQSAPKFFQGRCGQNLGLRGGSSCIHTKIEFEPLSSLSSLGCVPKQPFDSSDIRRRTH